MTTDYTQRAELINAVRALLDWLEANPKVPVNLSTTEISFCVPGVDDVDGMARLREIAELTGNPITPNRDGTHHTVLVSFGSAAYRATYITRESMAKWHALTSYSGAVQPVGGES